MTSRPIRQWSFGLELWEPGRDAHPGRDALCVHVVSTCQLLHCAPWSVRGAGGNEWSQAGFLTANVYRQGRLPRILETGAGRPSVAAASTLHRKDNSPLPTRLMKHRKQGLGVAASLLSLQVKGKGVTSRRAGLGQAEMRNTEGEDAVPRLEAPQGL